MHLPVPVDHLLEHVMGFEPVLLQLPPEDASEQTLVEGLLLHRAQLVQLAFQNGPRSRGVFWGTPQNGFTSGAGEEQLRPHLDESFGDPLAPHISTLQQLLEVLEGHGRHRPEELGAVVVDEVGRLRLLGGAEAQHALVLVVLLVLRPLHLVDDVHHVGVEVGANEHVDRVTVRAEGPAHLTVVVVHPGAAGLLVVLVGPYTVGAALVLHQDVEAAEVDGALVGPLLPVALGWGPNLDRLGRLDGSGLGQTRRPHVSLDVLKGAQLRLEGEVVLDRFNCTAGDVRASLQCIPGARRHALPHPGGRLRDEGVTAHLLARQPAHGLTVHLLPQPHPTEGRVQPGLVDAPTLGGDDTDEFVPKVELKVAQARAGL
jgi:hypothetical protein